MPPEKAQSQLKLSEKYKFNVVASNMMSFQRSFPDIRTAECKSVSYLKALPNASVIITFRNELWSLVVRTIWGVINNSPKQLIKEIILVDDASELDYLEKPLSDYLKLLPMKCTLLRMEKRVGLPRARLIGAKNATVRV